MTTTTNTEYATMTAGQKAAYTKRVRKAAAEKAAAKAAAAEKKAAKAAAKVAA